MDKLSSGKRKTTVRMFGVFYILSMTTPCVGGDSSLCTLRQA